MLPKTTDEQRSRFYEDVETLLSPGFLTHQVTVAGVRFQLRSLSSGDLFMLKARTEGTSGREWRIWTVASAIWMINGRVVLGQDEAIPFLAEYLEKLPNVALGVLFSTVLGLWVRVGDAIEDVEAFNYEVVSRYKWKSLAGHLTNTGVPGSETLGLNTVQRIWIAFNEMEDSRRSDETAWEGFKLVASSNAPKAVTKIDEKDRQRRRSELEAREKRLDQFYYQKIGLVKKSDPNGPPETASFRMASKSVEDLEEEMRRWVTGDADIHDQVVAEYKARIKAQRAREQAEMESRRQALAAERARLEAEALEGEFKPQPLLALTGEQLQQMLQGKGSFGRGGTVFIPLAPNADRLYNKYLADGSVTPGQLQVAGGRVVNPESNPDTDIRTLNQLIQNRNPAFGAGD